jgi:hypothetical protein
MFISILYMFRATSCSSSGESILSIQHLVCVTLCRWPSSMQVGKELTDLHTRRSEWHEQFLPDVHTRRSPTKGDTYHMLYWYNWFSWWWARGCSKHVENWNKHIEKKNCASSWSFTRNTRNFSQFINPTSHTSSFNPYPANVENMASSL